MTDNIEGCATLVTHHFRDEIGLQVVGEAARYGPCLCRAKAEKVRSDNPVMCGKLFGHPGPLGTRASARVQKHYRLPLSPGPIEDVRTFEEQGGHSLYSSLRQIGL